MAYKYAENTHAELTAELNRLREVARQSGKKKDIKKADKFYKKIVKKGWDPENLNPVEEPEGPPEDVSYEDWMDSITAPIMSETENWRDMPEDSKGHKLGKMFEEIYGTQERMREVEKNWRESGGEGLSPQMQALTEGREDAEEVRRALGIDPTHAFDTTLEENSDRLTEMGGMWDEMKDDVVADSAQRADAREAEWNEFGPVGERYSAQEKAMSGRMSSMGGAGFANEYGGNTKKFLSTLMDGVKDDSELAQSAENNLLLATQGKLTGSDSEWMYNQMAARKPYVDDILRGVKEAAGAQRGIGGGRLQRELSEQGTRAYDDIAARLADMQSAQAAKASDYVAGKRAQNVNLAGTAAGMQSNVTSANLAANAQLASHMTNMTNLRANQDATLHSMRREPLELGMSVDQAKLNNWVNQLSAESEDKTRTIETFKDPIESATEAAASYGDALNATLGPEMTDAAKKAERLKKKHRPQMEAWI